MRPVAEEVPRLGWHLQGWQMLIMAGTFSPLVPRGRALRGSWDGPQERAGLRQGPFSEGCGRLLGIPSGFVTGPYEGLIPADEGSGQVPAAALWVF